MVASIFASQQPAFRSSEWTPLDLGAKLYEWWDAERASSFNLTGSNVTQWTGRKAGTALTQATSSFKPVRSITSFNGRPGVEFDGVDDVVAVGSSTMPTGTTESEMWLAVDQLNPAGIGAAFPVMARFNGTSQGLARTLAMRDRSGVKRVESGPPPASPVFDPVTDFVGLHSVRAQHKTASTIIATDEGPEYSVANVLDRSGTAVSIGGVSPASGPAKIIVNSFCITAPLTTDERNLLWAFLRARTGV